MPFKNRQTRVLLRVRQSRDATEPQPIASAFRQPPFCSNRKRTVVGVFNRQLQQYLVRWPFFISTPQDVRLFAEEVGPNLQPPRHLCRCFTAEQVIILEYAFEETHAQLVQEERKVAEESGSFVIMLGFNEVKHALGKAAHAPGYPFL